MRRLHRWLATIAMVFLLWIALTGTALQVYEISHGGPNIIGPGGMPQGPPPQGPPPAPGEIRRGPGTFLEFLQSLHNGAIVGQGGRYVDVTVGIIFIVLSITGSIMFLQMLWQRRERGRGAWFWQ